MGGNTNEKGLRMCQGAAYSPQDILTLVAHGIDVIECPLTLKTTRKHHALVFPHLVEGAKMAQQRQHPKEDQEAEVEAFTEKVTTTESADVLSPQQNATGIEKETKAWRDGLFKSSAQADAD